MLSIGLITEVLIRLVRPKYVDEKLYKNTTVDKKAIANIEATIAL